MVQLCMSFLREAGDVLNEWDIYREWRPPPAWLDVVVCCWEQRVEHARTQRVVPDGRADVLIFDDGHVEVVGLHDRVDVPHLAAGTHLRGIRLRPAAVGAAFHLRASSLLNRTVAAEDILGSRRSRQLTDPTALDAWVRSIQTDERAAAAVVLLGGRSVTATADALGITRRHLDRLMLEHVGMPPKPFQRVERFQRFVRAIDAGTSLSVAAADVGYADQSHLTREVQAFSGLTPARLAVDRRGR